MSSCSSTVTRSCFERRLPPGKLEPMFKLAFGTFGKAAAYFHVERQTIARWSRLSPPPPRRFLDDLAERIQEKIREVHHVQTELGYYLAEPARSPRKPSGCCAPGYKRP